MALLIFRHAQGAHPDLFEVDKSLTGVSNDGFDTARFLEGCLDNCRSDVEDSGRAAP